MPETFTDLDLLDELAAYHQPIKEREGGFTHAEYAERFNVSIKTARKWCKELVDNGTHRREKCHLGPNSVGWVYYRNEG